MKIASLLTWIGGMFRTRMNLIPSDTLSKPRTHLTLSLNMVSSSSAKATLITRADVKCLLSKEVTPNSTYECCLYEITSSERKLVSVIPIGVEPTAFHGTLGNQSPTVGSST